MKTLHKCFNKLKKIDHGRTPAFLLYISSNNLTADLEKSESGSSSMSSSASYITVFLPVVTLDDEVILPVTSPLTCSVFILVNSSKKNPLPPVDNPNLKPPNPLPLQYLQIKFSASLNACFLPFLMLVSIGTKHAQSQKKSDERGRELDLKILQREWIGMF